MINFKYSEVIKSDTAKRLGIDNSVPSTLLGNLMESTVGIQKVRELLGVPMVVNSWFRCERLNKAVGGSSTSAHKQCLAVDFVPVGMNIAEAYNKIAKSNIIFDQLILERNKSGSVWIHIGFGGKQRRQVFEMEKK